MSEQMNEIRQKQNAIQALLEQHGLDALLLQRVSSFAWATCGAASYVNTASSEGTAALLFAPSGLHLVTNNIEATRLEAEEKLKEQGWKFHVSPWYGGQDSLTGLTKGLRIGSDTAYPGAVNLSGEVARLRARLTVEEGERFRNVGQLCAETMESAIRAVHPGQTEHEIAALLAREAERRGLQAPVNLIATDERIFAFRHPLPTGKKLDRYAMLVLCGRRGGLVGSITRLVHFGHLPDELRRKEEAVARVDATFIAATRPGRPLNAILQAAVDAYTQAGFADEWQLHHQGGPAAYEPREYIATPKTEDLVFSGQAYAWNPSITGTKSEDTFLVGETQNDIITAIQGWPTLEIEIGGVPYARPRILEVV